MRTAREKLEDNEIDASEVMLLDEEAFNESLIGTTMMEELRAVYDYDKMIEEYAEFHHVSLEDAADYVCYNVMRSLPYYGSKAPIIVDQFLV